HNLQLIMKRVDNVVKKVINTSLLVV
ncbi:MAG: hypothetical protein RL222_1153, partial [Bacteroidota bacterium]